MRTTSQARWWIVHASFCAIVMGHFTAVSAQTAASFKDDLIRLGLLSAVERTSDSMVVRTGPKFRFISAPQAHAAFCQRLLAHVRLSSAEVTRVELRAPDGGVLGSCTGSGYTAG